MMFLALAEFRRKGRLEAERRGLQPAGVDPRREMYVIIRRYHALSTACAVDCSFAALRTR